MPNGAVNWIGSTYQNCGPRCTNLTVYQEFSTTEDRNVSIGQSSLFTCESTISEVDDSESKFKNLSDEDQKHLKGSDEFARIAAGAIAWTGYFSSDMGDRQIRSYLRGSQWSPNKVMTKNDVEELLARYAIGAIAVSQTPGAKWMYLLGRRVCAPLV